MDKLLLDRNLINWDLVGQRGLNKPIGSFFDADTGTWKTVFIATDDAGQVRRANGTKDRVICNVKGQKAPAEIRFASLGDALPETVGDPGQAADFAAGYSVEGESDDIPF